MTVPNTLDRLEWEEQFTNFDWIDILNPPSPTSLSKPALVNKKVRLSFAVLKPFAYFDQGKLVGPDVDVWKILAAKLHLTPQFIRGRNNGDTVIMVSRYTL
jgi:ABC-type amino acid transport substrate-binding protein